MLFLFSLEKVPTNCFTLGGDKDATHNGVHQCIVPVWSVNMVVTEEILPRD